MGDVCVFSFYCSFFFPGGDISKISGDGIHEWHNRERLSRHCHTVDCRSSKMSDTYPSSTRLFLSLTLSLGVRALSLLMSLHIGSDRENKGVKENSVDKSRYISAATTTREKMENGKLNLRREISHRVRSRRIKVKWVLMALRTRDITNNKTLTASMAAA